MMLLLLVLNQINNSQCFIGKEIENINISLYTSELVSASVLISLLQKGEVAKAQGKTVRVMKIWNGCVKRTHN